MSTDHPEEGAEQQLERPVRGVRTMRRKAIDTTQLVETHFLRGREGALPLVFVPAIDNVDLAEWAASHRAEIESNLDQYGALLFRGFGLDGAPDFERVAAAIAPDLYAEYGDLPPEPTSQRIYGSTPYPADKMILFHNESSHLPEWPLRQFFSCVHPSETGGETPLLDCRAVCKALDPELLQKFSDKGLMYVRNFSEGVDVPWQEFFHTTSREEVERACAEAGMGYEWTPDGGLRVRTRAPAVTAHPRTGDRVFFNQIQLHHARCLDEETRTALQQLFSEDELPRNVLFGDGSPIPDEVVDRLGEIYEELCVDFPWEAGDMIVLDNMLVAHARRPFTGPRKVLVAMAEMTSAA
jgi:alpha-ketoglutarate-dependent taurine dioxygenase